MSHDPIIKQPLEDIIGERFGRYSKYIIQERALPDVRDVLKPVQRRILYAMYHDKNFFDKPYRKSAKTVGLVIGNYHPHGDSSVYDAMVRLSQTWKMNMPLVDMQGNNGSVDDDPAAAMRYTEARISKLSHRLLENIDEDVVPFVLNFDDMTTEPSVLPARYPNLLVNGATGIAAGYATNIPPFNLTEVLKASIYRLHNPNCSIEEIMDIIKGPDFPTGAIIQSKQGIEDILSTGRGRIVIQAKAEIVENKSMKQIVITELPYEVIKSNVVRKIDELRFAKASEGFGDVMDVRDESDRNGLRIVIDCKRESDAQSILNLFFKYTELQVYYNANMVAIVDQRPKVSSVMDILDAYLRFREEVVLNRTQFRFAQKSKRLHILEGLMKMTSILDEIIRVIRASSNRANSRDNLVAEFGFSLEQASAIVDLQLYRLSSTDIHALRDEFARLANDLEFLQSIMDNKVMLHHVMVEEFNEIITDFPQERRSSIEDEISDLEVDVLSLISKEDVMVTLSRDGYLKKVSMRSYSSSQKDLIGLKEDDKPVFSAEVESTDYIVYVSNKGRYGVILVHDIEEARWRDIGSHLNQYVKFDPSEVIVSAFVIKNFNTYRYLVTTSQNGMVKKTLMPDLEVKRTNRMYDIMTLGKNDLLVGAHVAKEDDFLLMVSKQGRYMKLSLDEVNAIGAKGRGVIGMKLRKDDLLAASCILAQQSEVIFMSHKYQFKRMKSDDLMLTNRATQGLPMMRDIKSNPNFVKDIKVANIQDVLSLYNEKLFLINVKDISLMGVEQSFSSLTDESDFVIIEDRIEVPIIPLPQKSAEKHSEAMRLDL